jgi:hypothetical protein
MTNFELIKQIQSEFMKADMPEFKTGMEVEVYQTITE